MDRSKISTDVKAVFDKSPMQWLTLTMATFAYNSQGREGWARLTKSLMYIQINALMEEGLIIRKTEDFPPSTLYTSVDWLHHHPASLNTSSHTGLQSAILSVMQGHSCPVWCPTDLIRSIYGGNNIDSNHHHYRPVLNMLHKLKRKGLVDHEVFIATNQGVWWAKSRLH